jgi:ATP-dependent RNA helicase RhlE
MLVIFARDYITTFKITGMKFADLNINASLLNALNDLGLSEATPIQEKAFAVVMSGVDVCGIAQTGTGKTFAYLLPLLRQFKFSKEKFPQILILVPTRELCIQVAQAVNSLAKYMSVVVTPVYGGVNMKPQAAAIENGTDIIVATPGRLLDHILNGVLKTKSIKKIVIDEVDEMLNLGFRTQINRVLDLLPAKRQNLMFSATITEDIESLIETYFRNPIRVEAAPAGTPHENIQQTLFEIPNFNTKVNMLQYLLEHNEDMSKVLVFVSTKSLANQLFERMEEKFPEQSNVIHSNKEQNHRFATVQNFKEGVYRFIIATDIVARGIDIAAVTHVVNFDIPDSPENYIHRIGRTGRADKKGIAIAFATEQEMPLVAAIESLMKYNIPLAATPEDLVYDPILIPEEMPKVIVKEIKLKAPKVENKGAAFHEKKAKNKKVNIKISHAEKMMKKYGKKKTRGAKRK